MVASEITWTSQSRPQEVERYWQEAYPEIDTASNKIAQLERAGYAPVGYFALPEVCWLDNYYRPLQASCDAFLARHAHSEQAQGIIEAEREEVALYERFKNYYSYGIYIARKI